MIGGVVGDLMFCACAWSDRAEGILRHERYQAQNAEEHCQSECGKQNPPRAKSATIATREQGKEEIRRNRVPAGLSARRSRHPSSSGMCAWPAPARKALEGSTTPPYVNLNVARPFSERNRHDGG